MWQKKDLEVGAGLHGQILLTADAAVGQALIIFGAGSTGDRREGAAIRTAHDLLQDAVAYLGHGGFLLSRC